MIPTANPILRATRNALLRSCATVAVTTAALTAQQAGAQAFNGTPTTSTGTIAYNRATPGVETITVGTGSASINWNATNNDFLPNGNTATFTSTNGITNYTVLNRIVPVSGGQIQLNGNVIATLQGTTAKGGNVWFYSPSGIMVGATATFDVGGLMLTSINPTLISNGAGGFSASFAPLTGDGGPIQILDGAQISALQQNSYVAVVAPSIEQGGTVKVDGSVAYVAANDLTMTMNQGLFDIEVSLGTDDGNGVVHTGTTTGGATDSLSDDHRIYMVAVPKNEALTMLLGGTIGYGATAAGYENGQVVLGAGTLGIDDIPNPEIPTQGPSVTILDSDSNFLIDDAHLTSNVRAMAMNQAQVIASDGNVTFDGNLYMNSYYGDASLIAQDNMIQVDGTTSIYTTTLNFAPFGD